MLKQIFNQRVVGFIVVIIAAIVILPIVFDGQKYHHQQLITSIPQAPRTTVSQAQPSFPEAQFTSDNQQYQPIKMTETPSGELIESPLNMAKNTRISRSPWVIQLGAFRHKDNISTLTTKLKQAGFTSFTKQITTQSGQLTKVYVGPELDKKVLEDALETIEQLTKLQVKITRYLPTQG